LKRCLVFLKVMSDLDLLFLVFIDGISLTKVTFRLLLILMMMGNVISIARVTF